ncbi:MAG: hypothetical protein Q8928_00345 [Bacteroidota bacterium]|nr:hypothetical protein [Bacteroidota bacterium]
MKKIIYAFLISLLAGNLFAQKDSIKAGWGSLDYSIPESPAFNLLGNNPDNILKPSSVRSIALNIGNYYLANGSSIPKNFAVEIAPLLLNPKASLNEYNKNTFLYRTRLSLGSNVLSNGAYEMAEGIRFTIIDKTDLRCNDDFLKILYQTCTNTSVVINKAIEDYVKSNPSEYKNSIEAKEAYKTDAAFKAKINDLSKHYFTNDMVNPDSISKIRDIKRQKLWNAAIWEVGLAAMQHSSDSLINHSRFSKIGLWTTYGSHLSMNDQLLIGGKLSMVDSLSKWHCNVTIGARYYYGSNELRAFVQGEYRYEKDMSAASASLGCVFNITNGIWGQFAMNFIFDNKGNVTYGPGLNISFGTPEKKKI